MSKKEKNISAEAAKEKAPKAAEAEKTSGSKAAFIIGVVLCVILVPILIMNCALIVMNFIDPDRPPALFGYTPMIVLTDSMEPLIDTGDIIISQKVNPDDVNVGDVISFFDPTSPDNAILTHRVISIYTEGDTRYAVTAGDNNANSDYVRDLNNAKNAKENASEQIDAVNAKVTKMKDEKRPDYEYVVYSSHRDSKPVALTEDKLIGAYVYTRIPLLGKVSMFMQTTWGWVICIAVPLIAFLAFELISRKKKEKAKSTETDELLAKIAELEALKASMAAANGGAENKTDAPVNDSANDVAESPKDDSSNE